MEMEEIKILVVPVNNKMMVEEKETKKRKEFKDTMGRAPRYAE